VQKKHTLALTLTPIYVCSTLIECDGVLILQMHLKDQQEKILNALDKLNENFNKMFRSESQPTQVE
jgi:hypothetical protein